MSCACCRGIHKTTSCKVLFFVMMLALNAADVVADWCLYRNLSGLRMGLVYGPLSTEMLTSVLVFVIISTIIFPLELLNTAMKTFCDRPFINVDLFSAMGIWFADIPLTILNVMVAACREELVSEFQLAKGGVVMAGAAIRFLILMVRYCSKKNLEEVKEKTWESCRTVTWRVLVSIGVVVAATGSILTFIFALYHFDNGQLAPNDASRHFQNVGIFVDQNFISPHDNLPGSQWLKVAGIDAVRMAKSDLVFRYRMETIANQPKMVTADNILSQNLQTRNCYSLNTTNGLELNGELPVGACSLLENIGNSYDTVIRFHFMMPSLDVFSSSQIFGDIYYNAERRFPNGTADFRPAGISKPLRYFRYDRTSANNTVIFTETSLINIQDVWSTGFFKCESTGSFNPNEDLSLPVSGSYF